MSWRSISFINRRLGCGMLSDGYNSNEPLDVQTVQTLRRIERRCEDMQWKLASQPRVRPSILRIAAGVWLGLTMFVLTPLIFWITFFGGLAVLAAFFQTMQNKP